MTSPRTIPRTILLIEDDATFASYLTLRLQAAGYRVETAPDGLRALFYLRRQTADLILVDLALPSLDGIGLLEQLREERLAIDVPIIVLTGRFSARDVERAAALGVKDYIVKPFDDGPFLASIAAHLNGAANPTDEWVVLFDR